MKSWLYPCVLAAISVAGCGGYSGPPLFPTKGVVQLDGQPVDGATVTFAPRDRSAAARSLQAVTDDEGRFELFTAGGGDDYHEGAPAGEYDVTVVKPEKDVNKPARNYLPKTYSSAQSSGLAASVTKEGPNDFVFELKK